MESQFFLSKAKRIVLLPEDEGHSLYATMIDFIKENFESVPDEDFFAFIRDLRTFFFTTMNACEKRKFVNVLLKYVQSVRSLLPQVIEYTGIIFKYTDSNDKKRLLQAVFQIADRLIDTKRGVMAFLTFLKYTKKTYSNQYLTKSRELLSKIKLKYYDVLKDTVDYAEWNIDSYFASQKADVLLLIPEFLSGSSFLQPPICMLRTIQELNKQGYTADLLDNRIYNYSIEQLAELISNNYKYVVITSTPVDQFQTYFVDHRFLVFTQTCNYIQATCCTNAIVVCGAHGTVSRDMLLRDVNPDIIISGEYDSIIEKVVDALYKKESLFQIPNISFKINNEWHTSNAKYTDEKWESTAIDFSPIKISDYFGYRYIEKTHVRKTNWSILQATRGCPYGCTFCYNIYGKKVRYKKIDVLMAEMRQLEDMGCREFFFIDQTFTLNNEYVKELCRRMIDQNFSFSWTCETRADKIDEETVLLMKKAGCIGIWLGIETFDETVLSICKKGYTLNQLEKSIDVLANADMDYRAFIMVGMRGETPKSLETTTTMIEKLGVKTTRGIIQCTPRLGTELYEQMPDETVSDIKHFWQMDCLRGKASEQITEKDINQMIYRLLMITNKE